MAHELTIRADGTVEMAYLTGVERWHGLGNEVQPGESLEAWRKRAGLDWQAMRAQVRYAIAKGTGPESWRTAGEMVPNGKGGFKYEGDVVLFRNDNGNKLGIVTTEFQAVQPADIVDFWKGLVEGGGMELQTLFSLFGGRKLCAMARVGEASIIDPRNMVRRNLLIATALDGSMATNAFYCDTTVICNNTLQAAFGENTPKIKINHRSKFNAEQVKKDLGVASAQSNFESTLADMRKLAEKRVRPADAVLMACELVKPGYLTMEDKKDKQRVENSKPVAEICTRFLDNRAIGMAYDGMNGTAWGLLNSVTEYVDHAARASSDDTRMNSAFFGKGAATKERARDMLIAYAPSLDDVIASTNAIFARPRDGGNAGLLDDVIDSTVY